MSSPPRYRAASRKTGTFLLLFFAAIAVEVATLWVIWRLGWREWLGFWQLPLSCLPSIIPLWISVRIFRRTNRARREGIRRFLGPRWAVSGEQPDLAARESFLLPFRNVAGAIGRFGLRNGAEGIQWFASELEPPKAGSALLFEHEFQTGSGRTLVIHLHTIIAWPAGHPEVRRPVLALQPWCSLTKFRNPLRAALEKGGAREAVLAELLERHALQHDANTARAFLSPAAIAELQHAPRAEAWYVGAGWNICAYGATLNAENLERFLAHARAVVAAT